MAARPGEEEIRRARDAALHLLSFRARSVAEMEHRLRKKDFEAPAISEVVEWLLERGYLDDRAFARQFLTDRLRRRPRGLFALVRELVERGVERSLAERTLQEVMDEAGMREEDLARDAARRWLARQTRWAEGRSGDETAAFRRRLYGHLERKAFGRDVIRKVVDEIQI